MDHRTIVDVQPSPVRVRRVRRVAPSPATASVLSSLVVEEWEGDAERLLIPRAEVQLVARSSSAIRGGVDAGAVGPRRQMFRKRIEGAHWSVVARVRLGMHDAVLGVPPSEVADRVVLLDELWSRADQGRLIDQLSRARDGHEAAGILDEAIAARLLRAPPHPDRSHRVPEVAGRLVTAPVHIVARELGMSERNFRRVFRAKVGMSPKAFARLARFHRALRASRQGRSWATIAVDAGYYDQAHLIAEFRAITGATPTALLAELERSALSSGIAASTRS